MRIELPQAQGLQLQQSISADVQSAASFEKGEVVQATVLGKEGESYLLRTEDGRLFKARLDMDAALQQQDQLEFVVTSKGDGRMNLKIISITSAQESGETAVAGGSANASANGSVLLEALGLSGNTNARAVLQALSDMGVRISKPTLLNALAIMEQSGLTAQEAVFFAANHIPATEEAVRALHDMQQGMTTGAALFEIAQEAAAQAATAQSAAGQEAAVQQTGQEIPPPEQQLQGAPTQEVLTQETVAQGTLAQASVAQGTLTQEAVAQMPAEQTATAQAPAANILPQDAGTNTQGASPVAPMPADAAQAQPVHAQASEQTLGQTPGQTPGQAEPLPLGALSGKLLSMFMELDADMDGTKLKRAAADTAFRADILKELIQATQGRVRSLADKMSDAAAQTKLTQDVQRFYCLHIPIRHPSHDTAELYLYRNKKKGKGIDPEDTSILIGLGTQTMGRVESLIRVEKRNISLVFSIESEEAIPFMKERARELYPLLREHRYTLIDTKVNRLERATTLENAEQVLEAAVRRPRFSVDCRI